METSSVYERATEAERKVDEERRRRKKKKKNEETKKKFVRALRGEPREEDVASISRTLPPALHRSLPNSRLSDPTPETEVSQMLLLRRLLLGLRWIESELLLLLRARRE